jgi:hypothetical protein
MKLAITVWVNIYSEGPIKDGVKTISIDTNMFGSEKEAARNAGMGCIGHVRLEGTLNVNGDFKELEIY